MELREAGSTERGATPQGLREQLNQCDRIDLAPCLNECRHLAIILGGTQAITRDDDKLTVG